jgi:hypothetical protein
VVNYQSGGQLLKVGGQLPKVVPIIKSGDQVPKVTTNYQKLATTKSSAQLPKEVANYQKWWPTLRKKERNNQHRFGGGIQRATVSLVRF